MAKVEMHLLDGRVIDLSDLTVDETLARLQAEGITPDQVRETRHYLPKGAIPVIVCPRCGRASANKHDIAERYCGACHRFHDETQP